MFIFLMISQCVIGKTGDINVGKEGLRHGDWAKVWNESETQRENDGDE